MKTLKVTAETPGGKIRDLLKISDWDFNWQDTYSYKKPFRLPKGTKIKADFSWDNSWSNPRNAFSPPKRIRLGEGSDDEMSGEPPVPQKAELDAPCVQPVHL